jgi:dipeptidyl aminopeptidase/acylaminoacyl peptidase
MVSSYLSLENNCMRQYHPVLLLLIGCIVYISPGQAVTLTQLTAPPLITDVKVSPTGEYLALRVFQRGKHQIRFLDRKTLKPLGEIAFGSTREVGDYYWVNDERVVTEILEVSTTQESPLYYGELFAGNYDGKKLESIFGYRSGEIQIGSHFQKKDSDYAWAQVIDVLPEDDKDILISSTAMSSSGHNLARAVLLDTYTGLAKKMSKISSYPQGRLYTDKNGNIRLVTSEKKDSSIHLQALPDMNKEWIDIPESKYGDAFHPVAITNDGSSVFFMDTMQNDKLGLHELSLSGEDYNQIYTHKNVDITNAVKTTDGRGVYAARIDDGYPSYLIFPNPGDEGETFKELLRHFSDSLVSIGSRSRDGRFWIVETETDIDPGSFYLLDREENSIKKLFDSKPDVNQEELL